MHVTKQELTVFTYLDITQCYITYLSFNSSSTECLLIFKKWERRFFLIGVAIAEISQPLLVKLHEVDILFKFLN